MASGMSQKMEKLNDLEVFELLCKIDGGYRPTPAEGRALAERETLDLSYTQITALPRTKMPPYGGIFVFKAEGVFC